MSHARLAQRAAVRTTLKGIASVVAPGTAVTGLLYYFGWARTTWQAQEMGLEGSLLGYSVEDYLLQSLTPMFWPLVVGIVALVIGLTAHTALVLWATEATRDIERQRAARTVLWTLLALLLAAGGFCLLYSWRHTLELRPSRFESLAAPLAALVAVICGAYVAHLHRRFLRRRQRKNSSEVATLQQLSRSFVVTLALLILFWTVSHYATAKGADMALEVATNMSSFPEATIYSTQRLYLQPPVIEREMTPHKDGSYRYAYSGLKFLFLANGRYFLRPSDGSAWDRNIVIPDVPTLRMELTLRPEARDHPTNRSEQ